LASGAVSLDLDKNSGGRACQTEGLSHDPAWRQNLVSVTFALSVVSDIFKKWRLAPLRLQMARDQFFTKK
jgi:hypothetical protein